MRRVALIAAAFVFCTACKLSMVVGVDARADGSGTVRATVTLDKEAADRLRTVGSRLEAADLRKAGWTVTGPTRTKDGGAEIVATKGFNTAAELPSVIAEVAGPRRPLRDFKLERDRSFFRTKTRFAGVVDLTGGINAFGDDRLKQQTGNDVGVDVKELERQAGAALNKFFSVQVAVKLPGSVSSNAATSAGNGAVWRPQLGERVSLRASGSQVDARRVIFLAIAVVAAVALVIHLVRTIRRHAEGTNSSPLL